MADDMIDIKCSDERMKKRLIFSNKKLAANVNFFEKMVDLMNQKASNNELSIGCHSHKNKINSRR